METASNIIKYFFIRLVEIFLNLHLSKSKFKPSLSKVKFKRIF